MKLLGKRSYSSWDCPSDTESETEESVGLAAALFSGSGISPALDSISSRLGREDSCKRLRSC